MQRAIEVHWHKTMAKDSTDVLELSEFAKIGTFTERVHEVRWAGGASLAMFKLRVTGTRAELDYSYYAQANRDRGMQLGVFTLLFNDSKRRSVKDILWRDTAGKDVSILERKWATFELVALELSPASVIKQQLQWALRQVRLTQPKFSMNVNRAYGGICCISGCAVPHVLQAAHISPKIGSDATSNGILLRADLHLLFDSCMLAIHPKTLRVWLAPEIAKSADYGALHKKAKLRKPIKKYYGHAPSTDGLTRRWQAFKKMHYS